MKHVRGYISSYLVVFSCLCLWLFLWLCSSVTLYLSQHGLSCAVVTNNCKVVLPSNSKIYFSLYSEIMR